MTIAELKPLWDSVVTLRIKDGETLRAKVVWVDEEYEDIIVEVHETDRPEHYKDPNAVYVIPAAEILAAQITSSTT